MAPTFDSKFFESKTLSSHSCLLSRRKYPPSYRVSFPPGPVSRRDLPNESLCNNRPTFYIYDRGVSSLFLSGSIIYNNNTPMTAVTCGSGDDGGGGDKGFGGGNGKGKDFGLGGSDGGGDDDDRRKGPPKDDFPPTSSPEHDHGEERDDTTTTTNNSGGDSSFAATFSGPVVQGFVRNRNDASARIASQAINRATSESVSTSPGAFSLREWAHRRTPPSF